MEILSHVGLGGAVHYKMFSWRTGCGKVFDPVEKEDSHDAVTCKTCLRSRVHDYDHLNEYGPFGIGIVTDPYDVEKMMVRYSVKDETAEKELHDYVVRLFHALEQTERLEINAKLPNIEMAISLGETLAAWRLQEFESGRDEPK